MTSERAPVRFAATLAANILRAAISFLTGILIARSLGTTGYGQLMFLLGSFAALTQLLDAGSTSAFYTLLSARRRTLKFFGIYAFWTFVIQFGGTILVLGAILPDHAIELLWVGHSRATVLLAFTASFMIAQTWNSVAQMGEAVRKTVVVQIASTCQALVHLVVIVCAIQLDRLTLSTILWVLIIEFLAVAIALAPSMLRANLEEEHSGAAEEVVSDFVRYCRPLAIYAAAGFLYQFADRWLLQRFVGSVQQAYFAVGQQFASISLLAATSIVNVFWKEIAEAKERGDWIAVERIYGTARRFLYFGAASISCGLVPYSREILTWTVGRSYSGGSVCLAVMFLYPIHQTLGYVQGTFYLALGETGRHAMIGLATMAIGIPLTYILVANPTAVLPGLGLGATGVAIKMVGLQLVGVALQMFLLRKTHGLAYDFKYQVGTVVTLLATAFGIKAVVAIVAESIGTAPTTVTLFSVSELIFLLCVATLTRARPALLGLTHEQFHLRKRWAAERRTR